MNELLVTITYSKDDSTVAVLTEETIIRYLRVGLSIVGFYLTYKVTFDSFVLNKISSYTINYRI
jgi:hypothetical protein